MLAASKYAGCGALVQWAQPASNHVYWCAANSEGDGKLLVDMWKSEKHFPKLYCVYF